MLPSLTDRRPGVNPPVLWTRGRGCAELARLLGEADPVRVTGDLTEACIRYRAELLVSRRLNPSFDLVSVVVPVDFEPGQVGRVVAAVAGGPNSLLAAQVAQRIGRSLGVEATMVSAYRGDEDRGRALTTVEAVFRLLPDLSYRLVEVADIRALTTTLTSDTLLVLGAPGGNWFQRMMFGKGARLRQQAPNGAVLVRRAPRRVFQVMGDPVFVGPLREAVDILRIHPQRVLAVVDRARLVGIVTRDALDLAEPGAPVEMFMGPPVSVRLDETLEEATRLRERFGADPIPVTDDDGRLVGSLTLQS